jgi:hypothetical protein
MKVAPVVASGNLRGRKTAVVFWVILMMGLARGLPVGSAAEVVVPNAQATLAGNSVTAEPFTCDRGERSQQVYQASELGSATIAITQIAFRLTPVSPGFSRRYYGARIRMSSTSNGPDSLSTIFADNVGSDERAVFSVADLTVSSVGNSVVSPTPAPFDIVVTLQIPFIFDTGAGKNLLVDYDFPRLFGRWRVRCAIRCGFHDCAANTVISGDNVPVDISVDDAACFLLSVTPSEPTSTFLNFNVAGANTPPAPVVVGVNTFALLASTNQTSDVVALATTLTHDGIANIPGPTGSAAFGGHGECRLRRQPYRDAKKHKFHAHGAATAPRDLRDEPGYRFLPIESGAECNEPS